MLRYIIFDGWVPSLLGGNAERKSQLGGQDLLGGSEHLLFPSGQAAFAVPLRKVFDDLRDLEQVARTDMQHIFPIALVPTLILAARNVVQLVQESLGLRSGAYRTYPELFAGIDRNKELRVAERGAERIILRGRTVNGALDNIFDYACAVQRV